MIHGGTVFDGEGIEVGGSQRPAQRCSRSLGSRRRDRTFGALRHEPTIGAIRSGRRPLGLASSD